MFYAHQIFIVQSIKGQTRAAANDQNITLLPAEICMPRASSGKLAIFQDSVDTHGVSQCSFPRGTRARLSIPASKECKRMASVPKLRFRGYVQVPRLGTVFITRHLDKTQ